MTVKGQTKDPEDGTQDVSFPQKKWTPFSL